MATGDLGAGVLESLSVIARHAPDVETMVLALGGLGRAQKAGAEHLLAIRADIERQADLRIAMLTDDYREMVRSELFLALARTEHFPRALLPTVLERPSLAASEWYDLRLAGTSTSKVEFEWRGELALVAEFTRQSKLGEVLEATPDWLRLDGRLLIQLGFTVARNAQSESEVARAADLLRAGRVALLGEASVDHEIDVRAQVALIRLDNAAKEWDRAADDVESLVADWRDYRIPARVWNTVIGVRDRSKGLDLAARYAAMEIQFRAHAALARGELERAREWSREARRRVGYSDRARVSQEQLEAKIANAK